MEVKIDGVYITLTGKQIQKIDRAKLERQKCKNSFDRMLRLFGFKKESDTNIYTNELFYYYTEESNGWYAEIIDYGNYSECWMTGKGLKNSTGLPGGWNYSTPEEVAAEILRSGL